MVPGIAPSADPMLQARMFAYPDAARYRLGVNYQRLPPNAALSPVYTPYQRDGAATFTGNYGGDPNYVNSSLKRVAFKGRVGAKGVSQHERWVGEVVNFTSEIEEEDFVQAGRLWDVLGRHEGQQDNFVRNVAGNLKDAEARVRKETYCEFCP
jgi:catalase